MKELKSLAIFYPMYCAKAWIQCTNPANAPANDLRLYQCLLNNISLMKNDQHNLQMDFQTNEAYLHKLDDQ